MGASAIEHELDEHDRKSRSLTRSVQTAVSIPDGRKLVVAFSAIESCTTCHRSAVALEPIALDAGATKALKMQEWSGHSRRRGGFPLSVTRIIYMAGCK